MNRYSMIEYIQQRRDRLRKREKIDYYEECIERLSAAVVNQAVKDYRCALKRLRKKPDDHIAQIIVDECEQFFLEDMEIYSDLDGKKLIRKIREKVEEEMEKLDKRAVRSVQKE